LLEKTKEGQEIIWDRQRTTEHKIKPGLPYESHALPCMCFTHKP